MVKEIYTNGLSAIARIEFSCVHAIAQMGYSGICLDTERWRQLIRITEKERDDAQSSLEKVRETLKYIRQFQKIKPHKCRICGAFY